MKVSHYYKYNFVSPESIFAEVKEEFSSYFQTGVIDDLLFPTWTETILKKLGKSSYKIVEGVFNLKDYQARLPEGFKAVRELWLLTSNNISYDLPSAHYEQATCRIDRIGERDNECTDCMPKEIRITYKTTGKIIQKFQVQQLLKPGTVRAKEFCAQESINRYSEAMETFEVSGNKLMTNFPEGILYMVYYITESDENDYQLIPDNPFIQDYIKAYLKYKSFEGIYNRVTDETFNQVQSKFAYYKREAEEAKVIAETEIKKQTVDQMIRSTKAAQRRFDRYKIS